MKTSRFAQLFIFLFVAIIGPVAAQSVSSADAETTKTLSATSYHFPEAGEARTVDMKELDKILATHGADLLVVNFWATWCSPCLAEMPHFNEVYEANKDKHVLFLGVSVDAKETWEGAGQKKLKDLGISYPNVAIYANADELIPHFSEAWGGDLPATFFYDSKGTKLGERLQELEKSELESAVKEYFPKAK